jgi:hypothetical protein
MSEYAFTMVVSGSLSDEVVDALYAAGCDDMTFSESGGGVFADVVRKGPDFLTAAMSSIDDVGSVPGLRVEAMDAGQLVTMAEIAERLEHTRRSVHLLVTGERGPGGFPPPAYRLHDRTRIWVWSDVAPLGQLLGHEGRAIVWAGALTPVGRGTKVAPRGKQEGGTRG